MSEEAQSEVTEPKYKIIDNALDDIAFATLKTTMMGIVFDWHFANKIVSQDDLSSTGYFIHNFYSEFKPRSQYLKEIAPILRILKPQSIIRIKANFYTKGSEKNPIVHGFHQDFTYPHQAAIFYINTNNGFTILEDGTKIESIANRLLLFDGSRNHSSTDCTDAQCRINIGFNFFNSHLKY
jgi:hypothetical protein